MSKQLNTESLNETMETEKKSKFKPKIEKLNTTDTIDKFGISAES